MPRIAMTLAPQDERPPRPEPGGLADDRMGDALEQRIAPAGDGGLEHRARHVPLQQVHAPAAPRREVYELLDEEAVAGAGQAGGEPYALPAQRAQLLRQLLVGIDEQPTAVPPTLGHA